MDPVEPAADSGFDMNSAVDDVSSSLGFGGATETPDEPVVEDTETPVAEAAPVTRQPPKSWAKEYHEHWSKTDPKVQEYIEKREKDFLDGLEQYKGDQQYAKQLKDILTPYQPLLQSQGVTETQAVQYLMNAHYRLTNGTSEERKAAYENIGKELGLVQAQANGQAQTDPAVAQLQKELNGVKSVLTQRQQRELAQAKADAEREVDVFRADPANLYFDELQQDIVEFINSGHSLKDAYDRAVWANPIVRQKEIARTQTEATTQAKAKAKDEADAARKTMAADIRGQETRKAPTEPKGRLLSDEDMRDTLKKIRERSH